jgi:hypothetical protein
MPLSRPVPVGEGSLVSNEEGSLLNKVFEYARNRPATVNNQIEAGVHYRPVPVLCSET